VSTTGVRRLRWLARPAAVAVLAMMTVAFVATPAFAHSELVKASPAPGIGLPQAPGAVELKFTEPLNRELSRIDVFDRADRDVGQGATEAVVGDRAAMRRRLGLLQPGSYRVRWVTVSSVDGHTLKGSYGFGIGDSAAPAETVAASPVSSEGWGGLVGRALAFAGLALWTGGLLLYRRARHAGVAASRLDRLAWAGPVLVLFGTGLSVLSSAVVASGSLRGVRGVLLAGPSGHWRLAVLVAAVTGLAVAGALRVRRSQILRVVFAAAAAVAVTAEAASGHSAATSTPVLATASLAVHTVAVGVWVFAIVASLLSGDRVVDALSRFSPAAIVAAVAVAATGVLNAVLELNDLGELTSTGYGQAILWKAGALTAMATWGAMHAVRRRSALPPRRRLRDLLAGALGAAIVAIVVAAVLVGFPNPPRQEAAAEEFAKPTPLSDLGGRAALTLADGSGPFLIALTVLPPQPGPIEARVHVTGVEPGDGLRNAVLRATRPGQASTVIPLRDCGLGCFKGEGDLTGAGDWRLEADVTSNRGPITIAVTVPLPTPNGRPVLDRAVAAMGQLTSLRVHETLRSDTTQAPVVADYSYRAPDSFSYSIVDGAAQITIGRQRYLREQPTEPWTSEGESPVQAAGFSWPAGFYRSYWSPAVAIRTIGIDIVGESPTDIVVFFRSDVSAWFKLWVSEGDGRVLRMQMRAEGHLMDHDLTGFDQPVDIHPPTP
jgi:copper transport protein